MSIPKAERDPYVRVYYSIIGDERFATVYGDNDALATWLRLLLSADALYPAPAPLPLGLKKGALDKLTRAGLVDLLPGNLYRIHGLDAERQKRSAVGRAGAAARWDANALPTHSERTNGRIANPADIALLAEPSLDEPSKAEPRHAERAPAPDASDQTVLQKLAEELTGTAYVLANLHGGLGAKALDQLHRHGLPAVVTAWRLVAEEAGKPPTIRQLIFGAEELMDPIFRPRPESKADEKARNVAMLKDLAAQNRREREERQRAS